MLFSVMTVKNVQIANCFLSVVQKMWVMQQLAFDDELSLCVLMWISGSRVSAIAAIEDPWHWDYLLSNKLSIDYHFMYLYMYEVRYPRVKYESWQKDPPCVYRLDSTQHDPTQPISSLSHVLLLTTWPLPTRTWPSWTFIHICFPDCCPLYTWPY